MSKREDHKPMKMGQPIDSGHADYMLHVEAEFIGERHPDDDPYCYMNECHAVIYTDGYVAVTLYECCYALWHLDDGLVAGGSLWVKGSMRLVDGAVDAIRDFEQKKTEGIGG